MRLGSCKPRLSNCILLIVPRRYFCGGSNCFMVWCLMFMLFAPNVRLVQLSN